MKLIVEMGSEPNPPALVTDAAIAGVSTPAMGDCMIGYLMPNFCKSEGLSLDISE